MSEQSQTAADTPSETQLCKKGCGFFGSPATGGCCSKCWRESQKKEAKSQGNASTGEALVETVKPICQAVADVKHSPMEVDVSPAPASTPTAPTPSTPDVKKAPSTTVTQKKRKKKTSYKNMMKGIMQSNSPSKDIEKEKESLRKVTGGGAFTKIDKI